MIVLFTSNIAGGVLQFVIQVLNILYEMGYNVKAFIPEKADVFIDEKIKDCVIRYPKVKTINLKNSKIKNLASQIMDLNPALIWYFDNGIATAEVGLNISKKYKQILIMHDAGGSHPSNKKAFVLRVHQRFEMLLSNFFERKVSNIMLLSKESVNKYNSRHPDRINKTVLLNLGAHVPNVPPQKPSDSIKSKFFLFFGRIDKYKGINNMLLAYSKYKGECNLIIAGNGVLTEDERSLIDADERVIVLNRYIKDSEMIWLFQNAIALVLPYIEATQSGIIPIAYKFGKPVIVSDVEGLTQFVTNRETGYICSCSDEYVNAFNNLACIDTTKVMGDNCKNYYNKNLDWTKNIRSFLTFLGI